MTTGSEQSNNFRILDVGCDAQNCLLHSFQVCFVLINGADVSKYGDTTDHSMNLLGSHSHRMNGLVVVSQIVQAGKIYLHGLVQAIS